VKHNSIFNRDNFNKYKFKSLHVFDRKTIIDPKTGKIYRQKYHNLVEITNPCKIDIKNTDFSNYFEDGDVTGIRMRERLQFILTKYNTINDIFNTFDMYPTMVAWNGITYLTPETEFAYKYMINIVNEKNYSDLFDFRLNKYFTYGFSIVLPELDIKQINNVYNFTLNTNEFKIKSIQGNAIFSEVDSHINDKIQSINSLEKQNNKSLYQSTLFCSLVSLLRYIKINNIPYKFSENLLLFNDNNVQFRESLENIKFIDKINSRINNNDFYEYLRINV